MTGIPLNGRVKNHAKGEFSIGVGKKIQKKRRFLAPLWAPPTDFAFLNRAVQKSIALFFLNLNTIV
jgi:hypothetical protein